MTTIATPISTANTTSRRRTSNVWIAFLVGGIALVMLAVATFAIVRSTNSTPAVKAVHVAAADPVAHGTSGHLMTTDGVPISPAGAASETDLLVHGGPGSAVTLSGERLH